MLMRETSPLNTCMIVTSAWQFAPNVPSPHCRVGNGAVAILLDVVVRQNSNDDLVISRMSKQAQGDSSTVEAPNAQIRSLHTLNVVENRSFGKPPAMFLRLSDVFTFTRARNFPVKKPRSATKMLTPCEII